MTIKTILFVINTSITDLLLTHYRQNLAVSTAAGWRQPGRHICIKKIASSVSEAHEPAGGKFEPNTKKKQKNVTRNALFEGYSNATGGMSNCEIGRSQWSRSTKLSSPKEGGLLFSLGWSRQNGCARMHFVPQIDHYFDGGCKGSIITKRKHAKVEAGLIRL